MTDKSLTHKICTVCKLVKSHSEFMVRKEMLCGYDSSCNKCKSKKAINYSRTKDGLVTKIYCKQRTSSKVRNHAMPEYTLDELREWVFGQENFEELYLNWVESDYVKDLTPSIDRNDDYKPYSFNNITLMTWVENDKKGARDVINGTNNKRSKTVKKLSRDGILIETYYSMSRAFRETGISIGNISECCSGRRSHAGGFKWSYE